MCDRSGVRMMPKWLTDVLKGLGSFVGGLIGAGSNRPPKRPRRVSVPDDIWNGSPAGRDRRRPPENGHAEYEPDDRD